jgi:chromosome segregation ATPase
VTAIHTPRRRRTPDGRGALVTAPVLAGALLIALLPASFAGGGTRSWWRRGDNRADAVAAKDAAAQAFYELDTAQREVRISVEAIDAAEGSSAGARRAVEGFAEVSRRIDEASHVYISAVDAHDLEADELDAGAASRARAELGRARDELRRAKEDLDRFAATLAPLLERAEAQLSRLVPAIEQAKRALLAAAEALDAVRASGMRADDLAARLAALAPELSKLNQGAGIHGVQNTLRRADLKWARQHLVPWLGRRLRGESSGDGRAPKRPDLLPL